jgi:hypothetical protein
MPDGRYSAKNAHALRSRPVTNDALYYDYGFIIALPLPTSISISFHCTIALHD